MAALDVGLGFTAAENWLTTPEVAFVTSVPALPSCMMLSKRPLRIFRLELGKGVTMLLVNEGSFFVISATVCEVRCT